MLIRGSLSIALPVLLALGLGGCATNTAELKRLSDAVAAAQRTADESMGVAQEALDTAKKARGEISNTNAAAQRALDVSSQAVATANKAREEAAAAQDAAARAEVKAERMFTKAVSK
jgi:sensor c-di-GMP phosphodiesterase-like protein